MGAFFPILKAVSYVILLNVLKVVLDYIRWLKMPLAIIGQANRAKKLFECLRYIFESNFLPPINRNGHKCVHMGSFIAKSLNFSYSGNKCWFVAVESSSLDNFVEEADSFGQEQVIVVEHLLEGQIKEVFLADLHPLLVVLAALKLIWDCEHIYLVHWTVLLHQLLQIQEVLRKLVWLVLVGLYRHELWVEAMAVVNQLIVVIFFVALMIDKSVP